MTRQRRNDRKKSKYPPEVPGDRLVSLSTKQFYWLREEAWEKTHKEFLVHCGEIAPINFFRVAPVAWILAGAERQPLGLAQAQTYQGKFALYYINFSLPDLGAVPFWIDAVSLLLSSVFIAARADLVHLTAGQPERILELAEQGWGEKRTVWTPAWVDEGDLHAISMLEISPAEWQAHERGKADYKTLHYLTVRNKRPSLDEFASKKKKPGVLRLADFLGRLGSRWKK